MIRYFVLAAALLLAVAAAAFRPHFGDAQTAGAGWPTFHGNIARDGNVGASGTNQTTILNTFQLSSRATSEIPSSPVVDKNGVAYIGDDAGKVYALDPVWAQTHNPPFGSTGEATKWVFATNGSKLSPPQAVSSTPTLSTDGSKLYFGADDGNVYAVTTADGKQAWATQVDSAVRASPLLSRDGSILYVPSVNGNLYALNAATGAKMNVNPTCGATQAMFCPGFAMPTSLAASPDGGTLYVVSGTYLYAVPASGITSSNGARIFYLDSNGTSTPVVDSAGNIYVGTQLSELEIFSPSQPAPIKTFQIPAGGAIVSSPAILQSAGLAVFGAKDGLYAINISSGLRSWSASLAGFSFIDSSPAYASGNNMVYVGTGDGTVYEINATNQTVVGQRNLGSRINASVAVAPDGSIWASAVGGLVDHIGPLTVPPAPNTPTATPTLAVTNTPTPTSTPVPTNTPTPTATPAQVPLSISVSSKTVADGQRQSVEVTSAPNTAVHLRVDYPNGDHQSSQVTTDGSGKATYSFKQGSSKMTHNKFTATVTAKAGSATTANTATATYQLKFGTIDVSAEPRKLGVGKTVDVFVHAAKGSQVQVFLVPPGGKLVSGHGRTGPKGFASIKFKIPAGLVKGKNVKVPVLAKFAGKPNPSTKTFITIT